MGSEGRTRTRGWRLPAPGRRSVSRLGPILRIQATEPAGLPKVPGVELLEEIGRGGMGVVYLGRQPKLDRLVAVKVLRPWTGVDDELLERFLREARAAALTDAAIVPLHELGVAGDTHYLVMAHMPGGSLRQVIESRRLAPPEAVTVGRRIAGALATAHAAGVLHRDVKPSNILLDARGNPFLSDFGIAQLSGLSRLTGTGASPGTAEYMAPELATGAEPSEAADVYSLGATLYECVSGRPPFTGANHVAVLYRHSHEEVPPLPEEVPEPLAQAIMRSLAKRPEERFPNAAALEKALAEVPAEPVAVARESVPSVSAARPLRSAPPAPDVLRATLSVAGRRPVDAVPKRAGLLGRLRAAVPRRLALGAGGLIPILVLAAMGVLVLPRLIHPLPPTPHRVTPTVRTTPVPTSAAAATAPLGPKPLPAAPKPAPAAGTGASSAAACRSQGGGLPSGSAVAFQGAGNTLCAGVSGGAAQDLGMGMAPGTSPAIAALPNCGSTCYAVAFQANTGHLWAYVSGGAGQDLGLGMAPGTSPSITALPGCGSTCYAVAFQANTSHLWAYVSGGAGRDLGMGMAPGTSPSITALPSCGSTCYAVAFQANTTHLWAYVSGGAGQDLGMGMASGTSPSITALPGCGSTCYAVAFQANTTHLWAYVSGGAGQDLGMGMASGTSPSIAALPGCGSTCYAVSFEANTTHLWAYVSGGAGQDLGMGMASGTSPSITALPSCGRTCYGVAFQANTGRLWAYVSGGAGQNLDMAMDPRTSPAITS